MRLSSRPAALPIPIFFGQGDGNEEQAHLLRVRRCEREHRERPDHEPRPLPHRSNPGPFSGVNMLPPATHQPNFTEFLGRHSAWTTKVMGRQLDGSDGDGS